MRGKATVVTGAGAGIGRGVALKFGEHGASVAAIDINFGTARETAREIRQSVGQYNIRVNSICPGCIQTPMLDRSFTSTADRDAYMERLEDSLPFGRVGLPEDIANVALFLASPLSAYVTGIAINVDGGMMSKLPLPE